MGGYGYRITALDNGVVRGPLVTLTESRRGHPSRGMRGLMLAVFEDAVRCYLTGSGRVKTEADEWVRSVQRRSPFSFIVVCETLGLDPEAVRTALHRLRDGPLSPTPGIGRTRPYTRRTRRALNPPSLPSLAPESPPDGEA